MTILDTMSLVNTLDHINALLLAGDNLVSETGLEIARWIATRQGERGAYRGMFAPTQLDFEQGIHVFTGEKLVYASARHIMGEEAARAVWLLGAHDPLVKAAYERAIAWMHEASYQDGTYCCGRCTLAFWRHYWVGAFDDKEDIIMRGLAVLKDHRLGDGKWSRFPFFYTIYTLLGIDLKPAREELIYSLPVMERVTKRAYTDEFSQRRQMIIQNALAML
jgi:hypothetical protein